MSNCSGREYPGKERAQNGHPTFDFSINGELEENLEL